MPSPLSIAADTRDLATGLVSRRCRDCGTTAELNRDNFYTRPDQPDNFERRCQTCRRARNATVRAARRSGARSAAVPTRFDRKFGVEIECHVNKAALIRELTRRGVAVQDTGYTHRVMRSWKIVTDGSVPRGYELVSPPLRGAAGIAELEKACEALAAAGARVDRLCGLHVHHDVSDLDAHSFGRVYRAWSNNQQRTNDLVAASRRSSQWARALSSAEVARVENAGSLDGIRRLYIDRYRSLNIQSFPRYGTVEVRQHQGTINFSKIAAWIAYGQSIIALGKADGDLSRAASTDAWIDRLTGYGMTVETATFLKDRAAHFTGRRVPAAA